MKLIRCFESVRTTRFHLVCALALALPATLLAQRPFAGTPARLPVDPSSQPLAQNRVSVMVEMKAAPAGAAYAEALKTAQAQYDAARQVALSEIAKITSNPNLSGALSDSARHEVAAFNPDTATLKQTVAVMTLLKRDMDNRKSSLDDQLKDIRQRIAAPPGGSTSTPTVSPKATHRFNPATGQLEPIP